MGTSSTHPLVSLRNMQLLFSNWRFPLRTTRISAQDLKMQLADISEIGRVILFYQSRRWVLKRKE